jgi:branched-chain amino acid transport system substrate-binding protein
MRIKPHHFPLSMVALLAIAAAAFGIAPAKAYELLIPALEFRSGAAALTGIPISTGFSDYITLLNERDGGINGVKIRIAACETGYDTNRGVECYEKLKSGALAVIAGNTNITYALIPKTAADNIPLLSPGYGTTASTDGRVFPWAFTFPANYWSAASIIVKYIADQEGGAGKLRGKKIGLFYLNNSYGREPIPVLTALAKKHAFEFLPYPVEFPKLEQDALWEQIKRDPPDWLLLWGNGTMAQAALANAKANQFPLGRLIGSWWASGENDVQVLREAADGYLGMALQAPGAVCPVHGDILKYVYEAGKARDPAFLPRVGEVLYNRGLATAMWMAEAIKKAMELHGKREVTASDMRDGLEALDITEVQIENLGFEGMLSPMKLSCANHEGPGKAAIQQWDGPGRRWRLVSGFYTPDRDLIDPLLKAESEQYAKDHNIQIRVCR